MENIPTLGNINTSPIEVGKLIRNIKKSHLSHWGISGIENNIITEKQAAYLKGDSTVSQLLYIVHNIKENWTYKKITQGLFLDISSAFDKLWHILPN